MQSTVSLSCAAALCLLLTSLVHGELVRYEITDRRPFAEGESFGDVGPYEIISGRAHFAIDPRRAQNQTIVDLDLAPRGEDGRVHFSSDIFLLAPKDLSRGNGAVLYDVNNRGNKLALRFFNDSPGGNNPKSAGNGFLMRQGYTVVWSGWIGELLPGNARLRLSAPAARDGDRPITGMVRFEIAPNRPETRMNVSGDGHGAYRPTAAGLKSATLTWRLRPGDRRVPIPRDQFEIHVGEPDDEMPNQLPEVQVELPAGFRPGYLYELIYEARDPLVHGVCLASVRDLVVSLKSGAGKDHPFPTEGESALHHAYGFGVSQSGRFLREFLYFGFNESEQGARVFDGLIPHVAGGGLGSFNHRFAQPTAFVTQREKHDWPTDRFPFTYGAMEDPHSKTTDGILRRADSADVTPKIMHTQTSTEYWSRSGSLVHTDPLGEKDVELPENVRLYAFGGCQHGPASYPPVSGLGQSPANPADYRPLLRALLTALDRWCREDAAPPASRYPTIKAGTLVDWSQASTGFPPIPDARYPDVIQQPSWLDFGKRWPTEGIIDRLPPRARGDYRVLVPRCGEDGNELDCLLPVEVAVPIASYTGWSVRNREAGAENDLVGLNGSYLLLPATEDERSGSHDPRPSLENRYGNHEAYQQALTKTCRTLVEQGYLLEEDVEQLVKTHALRAEKRFEQVETAKAVRGRR
ncbi:MAG: alpha/beta hydrolase domain-containing protein [Pirellulaceae bacterium]